jgi:hypothetical protein
MNYRQAFVQFLIENSAPVAGHTLVETKQPGVPSLDGFHEYVQNMYFENPNGCVPAKYLGEDLMNDIHTKFYYPLAFLRFLFLKKHTKLRKETLLITIDPSYESPTNYNMTLYEQKIVLLQNLWNAWSFWFKDEIEFENWVEGCLKEMEDGLKKWSA